MCRVNIFLQRVWVELIDPIGRFANGDVLRTGLTARQLFLNVFFS